MEKNEITLSIDSEKMSALTFYLTKENSTVQKKMDEALRQLYEQIVPEPVREYLDAKSASAARPKRSPRPGQRKMSISITAASGTCSACWLDRGSRRLK